MASLTGKVALITGGSQGIGRATATMLASKGCRIAFNYLSNASAAASVQEELGEDESLAIQADASIPSDIDGIIQQTIDRFKTIDILVCCAAMFSLDELAGVSEDTFDRAIATNVKGPLFLVQKAVPYMRPGSRIILFSTTQCHASTVTPPYLVYNMTKGAIEQMTRVLAKDLGRRNIMVNAVAPGPTSTAMFLTGKSPELLESIASLSPAKRFGNPEEVAAAVASLCELTWVNGQILQVNGGMA